MPSPTERRRNNIRAGVFVTIAILLTVGVVWSLSDIKELLFSRPKSYVVEFDLVTGVGDLAKGSQVRVGGIPMGSVADVRLAQSSASDDLLGDEVEVHIKLDRKIRLCSNAKIVVGSSIIGSDAWLDIVHPGGPGLGSTGLPVPEGSDEIPSRVLGQNDRIKGQAGAGMLDSVLGPDAERIKSNVARFSDFLGSIDQKYESDILPIVTDVKTTTGEARELVQRFNEASVEWIVSIDTVTRWAAEVGPHIDQAIDKGEKLLVLGREVVEENRPSIRAVMGNVETATADVSEITARLKNETVDRVLAMLTTGQEALDKTVEVIDTVQQDYALWAVDFGTTMGNAQLASQQLKLATAEIRHSPWKLLYRPEPDEIQHELLYQSVRSFALAVSDLKATSESMERILAAHGEELAVNGEPVQRLKRNLDQTLQNYERVQRNLLDLLVVDGE